MHTYKPPAYTVYTPSLHRTARSIGLFRMEPTGGRSWLGGGSRCRSCWKRRMITCCAGNCCFGAGCDCRLGRNHGKDKEESVRRDEIVWAFYHPNGMPVTEMSDAGDIAWINLVAFSKELQGAERTAAEGLDIEGAFYKPGDPLAEAYQPDEVVAP